MKKSLWAVWVCSILNDVQGPVGNALCPKNGSVTPTNYKLNSPTTYKLGRLIAGVSKSSFEMANFRRTSPWTATMHWLQPSRGERGKGLKPTNWLKRIMDPLDQTSPGKWLKPVHALPLRGRWVSGKELGTSRWGGSGGLGSEWIARCIPTGYRQLNPTPPRGPSWFPRTGQNHRLLITRFLSKWATCWRLELYSFSFKVKMIWKSH